MMVWSYIYYVQCVSVWMCGRNNAQTHTQTPIADVAYLLCCGDDRPMTTMSTMTMWMPTVNSIVIFRRLDRVRLPLCCSFSISCVFLTLLFFFCFLIFIIIIPLPRIAFSKCTLARTQAQNKWIVLMRRGKPFYFLFNWIRARGSLCFGKKERKKMR